MSAGLSGQERDEALRILRVIRPCLDGSVPLTRVAAEAGASRWTLRRWIQRYHAQGLQGLCRQRRKDQGRRRLPEELQLLIEGLALQRPAPRISWVCRQAQAVARDKGWPLPSYARVYNIVRGLDAGLLTYAHEGSKAYREAFDLIYRRESSASNEMWLADHSVLDVATVDKSGRATRPWLTVIVDDFSRSVPGYLLGFEAPSSLRTALAPRQAIRRKEDARWRVCGIPARFYTDHGSDFTSRHMEHVAADLRMELVFSTPGMPRGRGRIERFFQTVDQLFLSSLPGYWPSGAPEPSLPLSLQELDARFREWLLADYHMRPNSETDEAPAARWETDGFLPHLPESQEHLDLLLLTVSKARKVHPDGIHFLGLRYTDPVLADYVGEDVVVRYDPRDLSEIRVFRGDSRLCRAVCPEIAAYAVTFQDSRKARVARRSEVKAAVRSRKAVVERLLTSWYWWNYYKCSGSLTDASEWGLTQADYFVDALNASGYTGIINRVFQDDEIGLGADWTKDTSANNQALIRIIVSAVSTAFATWASTPTTRHGQPSSDRVIPRSAPTKQSQLNTQEDYFTTSPGGYYIYSWQYSDDACETTYSSAQRMANAASPAIPRFDKWTNSQSDLVC